MTGTHSVKYQDFLGKLKRARIVAGLTQAEVATILGKSQSFVSKSESGERRVDIVELAQFARIYGRRVNYFA